MNRSFPPGLYLHRLHLSHLFPLTTQPIFCRRILATAPRPRLLVSLVLHPGRTIVESPIRSRYDTSGRNVVFYHRRSYAV